jgi:hypothetical protein
LAARLADLKLFAFDQFSPLATTYYVCLPASPALEEAMENVADLMQRLLEIQSGGERRSVGRAAQVGKRFGGIESTA